MYKNEEVLRAYLGYMRTEEPTIVFIAKNLVKDLDTKKKWIHVVDFDCWGIRGRKFAFNYIIVELFDRKLHPKYPEDANEQMRKAITWQAAHDDIAQQKAKGIMGPMFLITCPLYNKNKGKKMREELPYWNEEYGGFDFTGKVPTTTVVRMRNMEPDWVYRVTGYRKINDSMLQYIKKNYSEIEERILKEKHVEIEWFFKK